MNVADAITSHARTRPGHPALIDGARRLDYRGLEAEVNLLAGRLIARGIRPGDRVGIRLKDGADYIIALIAIARAWAVAVPMDFRAPKDERRRIAEAFDIRLIIGEAEATATEPEPGVASLAAIAGTKPALQGRTPSGSLSAAPFMICLSSGTTDRPKGIAVTHDGMYARALRIRTDFALAEGDRYFSATPLVHGSARNKILTHLMSGLTVSLYRPFFAPEELVEAVARDGATTLYVVPTVLRALLAIARGVEPLFPRLSRLVVGSAATTAEERLAAARALSPYTYVAYGATGFSTMALLRPEHLKAHPASVGLPAFATRIEIVDEAGDALPPGAEGRLRCHGPGQATLMVGGAANATERIEGDWYYPGDEARLSPEGFLTLVGRIANRIKRGGASISAEEVEHVLGQHPAVAEAAVVGVPSPSHGQDVVAFIVARAPIAAADLAAHCRNRLAPPKVPVAYYFETAFPRTTSGKVLKRELARRIVGTETAAQAAIDEFIER